MCEPRVSPACRLLMINVVDIFIIAHREQSSLVMSGRMSGCFGLRTDHAVGVVVVVASVTDVVADNFDDDFTLSPVRLVVRLRFRLLDYLLVDLVL